tara:strand:+ start:914 stop:1771 length:858 start_codon:yes stop_codon:yes gene_type:complete
MDQLQNHIQSYGNASDGIQAYKQMADNEFFDDWRQKVDSANKILDTASKSLEGAGGAVQATKLLSTVGKWAGRKLLGEGTTETEETGSSDSGATSSGSNATGSSDTGASASNAGDAGSGATVTPATGATTAPQVQAGDSGGGGGTGAQGASSQGLGGADDDGGSLQTPRTLNQTSTRNMADDVSEGPTLEGAPDSVLDKIDSGVVEDEAGAGILGDVGAVAGTAMDFLGPIGLLAGIGMSIYEAVHKTPKPPPPVLTGQIQAQKSAMVLPTFDSVQDTPASSSAF